MVSTTSATSLSQKVHLSQSAGTCDTYGGDYSGGYDKCEKKLNLYGKFARRRDECDRVNYDHTCEYLRDTEALQNDITIYGPKVLLVNLDDQQQINELEREGLFIHEGDMIFVTGRENVAALQEWEEPFLQYPDYDILYPQLDYDIPVCSDKGFTQELIVLEGVGTGKTRFDISLFWGGLEVRQVSLDVYVGLQASLTSVTPRNSCNFCGVKKNTKVFH